MDLHSKEEVDKALKKNKDYIGKIIMTYYNLISVQNIWLCFSLNEVKLMW